MTTLAAAATQVFIPRDRACDHTEEIGAARRVFVRVRTSVDLAHVSSYSLDPSIAPTVSARGR